MIGEYTTTSSFSIRKPTLLFMISACVFILVERCDAFLWLDATKIKHLISWFTILIYGVPFLKNKKNRKILCGNEGWLVFCTCIILYGISLFFQVLNGSFKLYTVGEIYYLLLPMVFSLLAVNLLSGDDVEKILTAVLYTALFAFVYSRIVRGLFTAANFISMFNIRGLFVDSVSLMEEDDLSNYFLLLFVYFGFRKKKFKSFLSALGCFLGYKRFAVLWLAIMILFLRFFPKHKKIPKVVYYITIGVFVIAPFAMYYMCTEEFAKWFFLTFHYDWNTFTMTRFEIINTVIDAKLTNYGLGTVTDFLEARNYSGQTNMHNDILRIYMETTIIGSFAFTRNYFKVSSRNWYSYFMMLFIFVELFVAHFIGPGSVSFWIVAYLAIFSFNLQSNMATSNGEGEQIEWADKRLEL